MKYIKMKRFNNSTVKCFNVFQLKVFEISLPQKSSKFQLFEMLELPLEWKFHCPASCACPTSTHEHFVPPKPSLAGPWRDLGR